MCWVRRSVPRRRGLKLCAKTAWGVGTVACSQNVRIWLSAEVRHGVGGAKGEHSGANMFTSLREALLPLLVSVFLVVVK